MRGSSAAAGPDSADSDAARADAARDREAASICPICDGARFVRVTDDLSSPDFGNAMPCECVRSEDDRTRRDRLVRYSQLGALQRFTFDTLLREGRSSQREAQERYAQAVDVAERYAADPRGWLVLTGVPGSGKTHIAAAIANHTIDRGDPALFLGVADLLDLLRASYDEDADLPYEQLLEQLRSAPLVVLDDLDSYSATPWAKEKFLQLISHRFHAALPTVFTCEQPPSEIEPRLSARLTDPSISQIVALEDRSLPTYSQIGGMTQERLRSFNFGNFEPAGRGLRGKARQNLEGAFRMAREWAETPEGWVLFVGANGCGKTHLASAIANFRLERDETVCFATVPDLLDELRSTFAPGAVERFDTVFQRLLDVRLLVLDDLGAQQTSPWAQEKLYQILNHRHLGQMPTVITTNLELKEMEPRIASRLADLDVVVVYEIEAPDFRRGDVN